VRPQISLAYLLARLTDTIADTTLVLIERRLDALGQLRRRILGQSDRVLDFGQIAQGQSGSAEKTLLQNAEQALETLSAFSPADQQRIRDVLQIIISGQQLDLKRFAGADAKHIQGLGSERELDDYTYRVAGCVGEFWTKICFAHLWPHLPVDYDFFLRNGIRFGKGLQLVNILRDIPRDLRNGRCYLPEPALKSAGLAPADLLVPANMTRLRPLYRSYLAQAEGHLWAGWEYTNALPTNRVRVRLACAWPVLIGVRTLRKLQQENVLDPNLRIKISRAEIRSVIFRSVLLYPFREAWKKQFSQRQLHANEVDS
jgi:farnesyl-diphosphate farnesyltransferase